MEKFKKLFMNRPMYKEPFDSEMVNYLRTITSPDTTLVSYYVKPNANPTGHIKKEISKTQKIKSKATRDSVSDALNKILSVACVTENGQALFSNGIEVWSVRTEHPVNTSYYLCEKYFDLSYFDAINLNSDIYLIVCLSDPFNFWEYQHGLLTLIKSIENKIPKKHKKGGQSSKRFAGIREAEIGKTSNEILNAIDKDYKIIIYVGSEILFSKMISLKEPDAIFRKCQYCSKGELYSIVAEFDNSMQWERDIISCLFEMLAVGYTKIDYGRVACERAIKDNNVEFMIANNKHRDLEYDKIILRGSSEQHEMFDLMGGVFVLLRYIVHEDISEESIDVTY